MEDKEAKTKTKWIKGVKAFAAHLEVSKGTIYNWLNEGLIKYERRIKNVIYFNPEDFIVDKSRFHFRKKAS